MTLAELEKYAYEKDIRFTHYDGLYYLKGGKLKNNNGHSAEVDSFEIRNTYIIFFYKGYIVAMCEPLTCTKIPKKIKVKLS